METVTEIIGFVLGTFALILFIILTVKMIIRFIWSFFENITLVFLDRPFLIHFELFPKSPDPELEAFLEINIPYFRNLTEKKQEVFSRRVRHFIRSKTFETREGLELTDEMMQIIASSAIKLTFGLRRYLLDSFDKIIIFPDHFYSGFLRSEVKGETIGLGYILFSWKDFRAGDEITNDKVNLGIHEFTHALSYEAEDDNVDNYFCTHYNEFIEFTVQEEIQHKLKDKNIIRDYGFSNEHEFFSVITEVFFENPQDLNEKSPDLYRRLAIMYNQDPLDMLKSIK